MITIDKLLRFGAKADEGLSRCMNNEAIYFRLIGMGIQDAAFERLEEALAAGDQDAEQYPGADAPKHHET